MASHQTLSSNSSQPSSHPWCFCGDEVVKLTAWTDANPGRAFYKCAANVCGSPRRGCNYFSWADKEPPYGWWKAVLLNSMDRMRLLKVEVDMLKDQIAKGREGEGNSSGYFAPK